MQEQWEFNHKVIGVSSSVKLILFIQAYSKHFAKDIKMTS